MNPGGGSVPEPARCISMYKSVCGVAQQLKKGAVEIN